MIAAPSASQFPSWHVASQALLGNLDAVKAARLAAYRDLILSWNQRFNLTALRTAGDVDSRLVLESLRLLACIRDRFDMPPAGLAMIDIGSGAGIPGIPICIVDPDIHVTMVEATGKKARFIQEVITRLGLPNARVEHARAEDLAHAVEHRETYDVAVARAVGSLSTLLELSMPFLRVEGTAFFPKGVLDDSGISRAKSVATALGARLPEVIPLPDIPGCPFTQVAVADKLDRIPAGYPRRAGIPAREPLRG